MLGHLGMMSLTNHDSRVRENSEVVIIYPDGGTPLSLDGLLYFIENPNRTWMIWGFHRGISWDTYGQIRKKPMHDTHELNDLGGTTMTCRKLPDVQRWQNIWLHHVVIFCIIVSFGGCRKKMAGSEMSDLWWFCAKVRGWGCGRNHETIQFWLLLNIGYRSLEYIGIIILGKHEHEQTCFTRVFVLTPVHMHHCNTSSSYIWHGISTTSGAIHQLTFLQWVRPLALSVRSV